MVGDVINLVPVFTGVGEATRAVKTVSNLAEYGDNVIDAAKTIRKQYEKRKMPIVLFVKQQVHMKLHIPVVKIMLVKVVLEELLHLQFNMQNPIDIMTILGTMLLLSNGNIHQIQEQLLSKNMHYKQLKI